MSDAREIIALALIDLEPITRKAAERYADHILSKIDRKGFRIIGPDEVDPVTEAGVEAAWLEISNHHPDQGYFDMDRSITRAALKSAMDAAS